MKKILLILLIGVMFFFGCIENDQNLEKKELILNSLEKQYNLTDAYSITYLEKVQNVELDIEIIKNIEEELVITDSEIDTKWIFFKDEQNIICEQLDDQNTLCANVTNDTRFDIEINSAKTRFTNEKLTNEAKKTFETLIEADVLDFKSEIINKTIDGRTCNQIEFQINYNNLSAGELSKIGLTSGNPLVNKYKNFTQTICYDDEYGIPLYIHLSYIDAGEHITFERTATAFSEEINSSVLELPNETTNISEFYTYFAYARTKLNTIAYCNQAEDKDSCFKQNAYELKSSDLCNYIEDETKRYQCLIIAINYDANPKLCEKIEAQEDKDACYLELTRNTGNKTYCDYIVEDDIENMCLELNVSIPEQKIECEVNSDCAIQGCNSEVCAPANESIMTTCEWKDIYACYNEEITSCECINGTCGWKLTSELLDCIDGYETKQLMEDLKNKTTNQTNTETEE